MLLGDHAHGQVVDAGQASAGGVSCGPAGVFFSCGEGTSEDQG